MAEKKRLSREQRETRLRLYTGLGITCLFLILYITNLNLVVSFDRYVYDTFMRAQEGGTPSPTPALIDIDDKSLKEFGQWPWPRHLVAKMVANLTESGVAAVGLDILFAEPDNASVINLQKSFKEYFNITLPLDSIPPELHDNDKILAAILAQSPAVIGAYSLFGERSGALPPDLPPQEGIVELTLAGGKSPREHLPVASDMTFPIPVLRAVAPLGTLNVAHDSDGIIRSVPLLSLVEDRVITSLSLRSLMRGLGINTLSLISGPIGLQAIRVGKYTIPVTPSGLLTVNFRGPGGYYPTFSASDILHKRIPMEELQGRIVIVGTSAAGLLDMRATPFDSVYPGAEVHLAVIDTILSNRFMEIPNWNIGAQMASIAILGSLGAFLFAVTSTIAYIPILIALISGLGYGAFYIFQHGLYISPLYAILTLFCSAIVLLAVRFGQEAMQKRTLRSAFGRYIAPDMVARIVDMGEVVLTGEEREVTLLFTDIRGFTTLSEKLTPDQVVTALNRYFTPMTAIIRASQGTMDKFIGDAVMAFWNAPLNVPRHPLLAITSALQMHMALAELNKGLEQEMNISLRMGAGVHTGKVYVGNMGSAELLDYTCIGDNVNLAARLEGMCSVYGVDVITSAETAKECLRYADGEDGLPPVEIPFFMPLDSIRVKGKTLPVEICTPITLAEKEEKDAEIQDFMKARTAYIKGDFASALTGFIALHREFPNSVLYELYTERSQTLLSAPPRKWDGVWTFTNK